MSQRPEPQCTPLSQEKFPQVTLHLPAQAMSSLQDPWLQWTVQDPAPQRMGLVQAPEEHETKQEAACLQSMVPVQVEPLQFTWQW